jgi:hypothetical protein
MRRSPAVLMLALLVGSLLALPAQAQWKWRDKAGQTQYSDLAPPAGTPEADILQRPNSNTRVLVPAPPASAASGADAPKPKTVEPELEAKRRKAEQEKADKAKAEDQSRALAQAENCTRAKDYLRTLQDGMRITRTNATSGEREFMDDKSRADETKRTREIIAADCK